MPAHFESWWPLASVSPDVDSGYWNLQIEGEVLSGHQLVELVHERIVRPNPFNPIAFHDRPPALQFQGELVVIGANRVLLVCVCACFERVLRLG